jgi:preprotein translocase subunit SecA
MAGRAGRRDPGFYPERQVVPDSALDRFAGRLAHRLRTAFARRLPPGEALAGRVAHWAAQYRAAALAEQVPALRYQLRRDGLAGDGLERCFGMYCAALVAGQEPPGAEAISAAAAMVRGGIVDCADALARWDALALAAAAFALCGVPVHLYASSEARAAECAERLRVPFAALGLGVAGVDASLGAAERRVAYGAAVTCGTHRVIAFDYLRDRLQLGRRLRPLQSRLERVAGDTTSGAQMLLLNGLHCALVEDADQVLLDDTRVPMVVSRDVAPGSERLPYEQALELARSLDGGEDYALAEGAARLTPRGAQKLAQLSVLLGGLWSARQRREELVAAALAALHLIERGRDYQVVQGALQLAQSAEEDDAPVSETLQRLLEVKEELSFGGRRDVLARLTVPQFFRRYLRLAGMCLDARGLEREFMAVYGMPSARAGAVPEALPGATRAFVSTAERRAALLASVRERVAAGVAVVVALRMADEVEAVAAAFQEAGVAYEALPAAAAALGRPGAVLLSPFAAHRAMARRERGAAPLHLAVADLHDAGRHVAQIALACGATSCEQVLALEDDVVGEILGMDRARLARAGELAPAMAARVRQAAQGAVERATARVRRDLLAREQSMEDLLAFSGRPE